METFASKDVDAFSRIMQFTPTLRRAVYEAISPKNPQNSASGKNVLITGATRGIGKGIAMTWAQAGASGIVITGRNKAALDTTAEEIKNISPDTKVLAVTADATSPEDAKKLWSEVRFGMGLIDVLICNAGVHFESDDGSPRVGDIDPERWFSVLSTNIFGPHLHTYNFLQQYLSEGKAPIGTVVLISSGAALFARPGGSAYSISKGVNARQAEALHIEYPGVRAFSVHPGMVDTDMAMAPVRHMAIDPPELAGSFTLYLSTPKADFLRGKYLSVNWDVTEMEARAPEIKEKGLLKLTFLNAKLGPGGHPFETAVL
ncbi:hypothetical protein BU24DRAFT_423122 [Aaosphaeria arxii CBS 175.79]|uniref:NAD(P)-binding protein n=1 Tax=Aaosphaeria arxii CBS 175.79 TaxID=1450172 RepID=A0A6A5XTT3_9PLEO|nr:uncharacterized protein BU24DRAFT_423122 [Aaosphaeria arxii CBS 175.79]KAF2016765.1 hypothetical protein BU24DRAFT_423122 [Aaosphaeria arxii CBS 175.79]